MHISHLLLIQKKIYTIINKTKCIDALKVVKKEHNSQQQHITEILKIRINDIMNIK